MKRVFQALAAVALIPIFAALAIVLIAWSWAFLAVSLPWDCYKQGRWPHELLQEMLR